MITFNADGTQYKVSHFTFAGGEVQTKVEGWDHVFGHDPESYFVSATIGNSDDLMSLMQVSHKLGDAWPDARKMLILTYTPYAQQDRMCEEDETLACKVFAQMINSLGYSNVELFDPHSDVMPALINRSVVTTRTEIIEDSELANTLKKTDCRLVSPDAGALKKTYELAKEFGNDKVIRADKIRDTKTGKILETVVYTEDLNGAHCVVVDDIMVGGRTFVELAKALKEKGAGMITLYVTHGIFSSGLACLEGLVNHVYTTDSRIRDENFSDGFTGSVNIIEL